MARELSCEDKSRNNNNTMVSSGGFCYSEASPTSNNNQPLQTQFTTTQIQSDLFHDHHHHNQPEIFNLTTGMDMIGFSKTTNTNTSTASSMWKGFDKPFSISESTTSHDHHQNLMIVGPDQQNQPWQLESNNNNNNNNMVRPFMAVDESSSLIFPCEGNERPSQGLSLTLSSNNPSTIGLQTFEFRHATTTSQNNQMMMMSLLQQQHGQFQLRSSKFLSPAQELLNEFCSLGAKQTTDSSHKQKSHKTKLQWELDQDNHVNDNNNNNGASSSKKQSLYSLEFMELHKRKTKLLSMLEEVERRYKKYCEQMRAVVSSFEAVAGSGAAGVYSALASKAMSRHFRSLKDGIVAQIEATRRAMGEKDVAASGAGAVPGTTRGETPRLRVIDQAVRQQRAVQQMTMMDSHPWRPQRGLPERSVSVLRAWLFEHFLHPYPSDVDKHILARQTNLSRSQVSNWFINARVRLWKPMVEEMYVEETREAQLEGTNNNNNNNNNMAGSSSEAVEILGIVDPTGRAGRPDHDQKPTPDQLVRIDSECLSSVVTNDKNTDASSLMRAGTAKTLAQTHPMQQQFQRHQNFGRFPDHSYNTMELDFSSYAPSALYSGDAAAAGQGFIGGNSSGGGVSLTLGLQQHAGAVSHSHHDHHGVSLAFSPASQGSLFYPRSSSENHHHHHHHHQNTNNIDDQCQVPAVQYSLLDGDQGQNLPYRNLMGAQLLHDLA